MQALFEDVTIHHVRQPVFDPIPAGFSIHHSGSCYLNAQFFKQTEEETKGKITIEWSARMKMARIKFEGVGSFSNSRFSVPAVVGQAMRENFGSTGRYTKPFFILNHKEGDWYYFKMFNQRNQTYINLASGIVLTEQEIAVCHRTNEYVPQV